MGKRGPPPKPTRLKLVQGTDRPDRRVANEPTPDGLPERPDFTCARAAEVWGILFPILDGMQVLTEADGPALARLCEWQAIYEKAERIVSSSTELTFVTESGYNAQIAEVGVMKNAFKELIALYKEFGMTPSARSQVSKVEKPKRTKLSKYVG